MSFESFSPKKICVSEVSDKEDGLSRTDATKRRIGNEKK